MHLRSSQHRFYKFTHAGQVQTRKAFFFQTQSPPLVLYCSQNQERAHPKTWILAAAVSREVNEARLPRTRSVIGCVRSKNKRRKKRANEIPLQSNVGGSNKAHENHSSTATAANSRPFATENKLHAFVPRSPGSVKRRVCVKRSRTAFVIGDAKTLLLLQTAD